MRLVTKGERPKCIVDAVRAHPDLTTRDSAKSAYDTLDKDEVRAALVSEQRHLCAFCERRLQTGKAGRTFTEGETGPNHNVRIAHRTPVAVDSRLALTWENLIGSCDDERTCDVAQGSRALTVDPTKKVTVAQIRYERRDGTRGLFASSDEPAIRRDLQETLRLNDADLPVIREAAHKALRVRLAKKEKYGKPALREYLGTCIGPRLPEHFGFLERMAT